MKKLIIIFLFATTLFAQIKSGKVIIKKIADNTIELRAKLEGKFDDLRNLNNADRLTYILNNYDAGFYFENYRDLGWSSGAKTIGKINRFIDGQGLKDTLVFTTTITNAQLNKNYYCIVYFRPKNNRYKFRLNGNEVIGDKLQDYACEPSVEGINKDKKIYIKGDTATISVSVFVEDFCNQTLTYNWQFSTYDMTIDTVITDTTVYDTTYVYSDWKNWTSGKNGWIADNGDNIVFEIMTKKWNNRKFKCTVSNSVGHDAKQTKIRVQQ